MIGLTFDRPLATVACLGAHPDDIEIGSAGTLRRLAALDSDTRFIFIVLTGDEQRREEAEESMNSLLGDRASLHMAPFRDGYLPYEDPAAVKGFLQQIEDLAAAQVVFAPNRGDRHQDHAFAARLVDQILRDHLVLGYEIAKYDGDLGRPQAFVALSEDEVKAKEDHLMTHFATQRTKHWYASDGFRALMRIRGIEANSPSGFAEAFHVSKFVLE